MAETPQDEKTEEPTQKKLDDSRQKGDVAKSQEVNSWFIILAATLIVVMFAGDMGTSLTASLKFIMSNAHDIPADAYSMTQLFKTLCGAVLSALALPFILLVIAGIAGNLIQVGIIFSLEPITPKLSKISPISGFKRLFSTTALVNFAKSLFKLVVVTTVIAIILWPNRDALDAMIAMDPRALMGLTQNMASKVLGGVLALLTLIAVADYAFQRHTWWQKQRMTPKELRDEYKQLEGDPQIRAKLRQVRIERGRKRMLANVPNASVVITNPTHYSIALQYETGMDAPVCLAKGIDSVALRIREAAKAHNIPIVENPPLARALHASVEIDEPIQPEHYQAVAEIIGYVLRLANRQSGKRQ
ncbi:flagellar biosynthetic protein FlhB [bacterium MnTg02]|nr:flagellar biosynthetic protein FlhB [bacterium MnTg02]